MTAQPYGARYHGWLLATGAVVAVVLVTAGVLAIRALPEPAEPPDPSTSCPPPTAPISAPLAAAEQAPGGGLAVVESGFSLLPDSGDVSIGAVVANTGSRVAYRTRLEIHALRGDGSPAVRPGYDSFFYQEIPVILPGQRVAVGAMANLNSDPPGPEVSRVTIQLTSTRWVPADPDNPLLRPITASITSLEGSSDGIGTLDFGITAAQCAGLAVRGTAILYRDAAGAVVGGQLDTLRTALRCRGDGGPQSTTIMIPGSADLDRTQISLYCDVAGTPPDPPGPHPPVT